MAGKKAPTAVATARIACPVEIISTGYSICLFQSDRARRLLTRRLQGFNVTCSHRFHPPRHAVASLSIASIYVWPVRIVLMIGLDRHATAEAWLVLPSVRGYLFLCFGKRSRVLSSAA
jgi:hypothetical protein